MAVVLKRIKELCYPVTSNIQINKLEANNGIYPLYGASGLVKNIDFYKIDKDYISIVKDGAGVGRIEFQKAKSSIVATMQALFNYDNVDIKWLYYALKSQNLGKTKSGATIPHIYFKDYGEKFVKFYDLNNQKKIVRTLDAINNVIDNDNRIIKLLDDCVKTRFFELFANKKENIYFSDCVKKMTKGPFGSSVKKDLYVPETDDAYKVYVQLNCLKKDEKIGDYFISKDYYEKKMKSFKIEANDYLITCDGTLGKYIRLSNCPRKGIISASLLKIKLDENIIIPDYFEVLWDEYLLDELKKNVRNGCLKHLPSAKEIGKKMIYLPSIEEQQLFSEFRQYIELSKKNIKRHIDLMVELLDKKMDDYFGGKV